MPKWNVLSDTRVLAGIPIKYRLDILRALRSIILLGMCGVRETDTLWT